MVDYGRDGKVFSMIADAIACAVLVTESAIALYEAQAQPKAGRPRGSNDHFPERLQRISSWRSAVWSAYTVGWPLRDANPRWPSCTARAR